MRSLSFLARFGAKSSYKIARVYIPSLLAFAFVWSSAWADAPPIGYVGLAPLVTGTTPPVGYIGPAPHVVTIALPPAPTQPASLAQPQTVDNVEAPPSLPELSVSASPPAASPQMTPQTTMPPLGYTGPVAHGSTQQSYDNVVQITHAPVEKAALASAAVPYDHTGETLISARQMTSDSATNIVTATGKVEVVRGDYVLHADKVTYNQKTGIMTADGHVAMLTPSGEVEFAEHQEVTGDMKQAFAENVGVLFPDNSRMAARVAQRYDERYSVADNGAYTSCNVCKQDPNNPPLWQLRADTITHDNVDHEIYYHDATIDMAGIPVAYTPYLSMPDPTVKRQQGFLSPQPGYNPNIGAYIKTPYYFDIAPDKDAVLAPTFSTTDKLQVAGNYRERFANGNMEFTGSIAHADLIDSSGVDKGYNWRGDLMGSYVYDFDNQWRAGTNVQYVSDSSYLQRYQISSLDQTVTRAYLEGFQGRDYTAVNSYYFQDLRPDVSTNEPVVAPSVTMSMLGDPNKTLGGRWSFDANTLTTLRNDDSGDPQQGFDTRRLSMNGGWERQLVSSTGLETTVSGLLRTDSYWANNVASVADPGSVYDNVLYTRPFEQANAVMRYPLSRGGENYQQLLEPIAAVTVAPNVRQIDKQPIEDSLDTEFDETNLFSPNRFTGSDLVEGGSRVTYGVRNAITMDSGARVDVFGGESYDFTTNSDFPVQSGLYGHASDYVGRVDFEPAPWINANYGFRLAQSDFSPQQQDALVSVGVPVARPSVRYIEAYQNDPVTGTIDLVRQATFGFTSHFAKYWTYNINHVQAFDPEPGPRNTSMNLTYVDECLAYGMTVSKDDTNRADISSGTSVTFHLYLKNLGGFATDSASNIQFPAEFRQTD